MPLKLLSRPLKKRGWNDQHSPLARRAALVGFVGTMPEYYDFIIYGAAAALIFPEVLFVNLGATTATMLSLLSFGIGFVARPVGAIIIGHYGNQLGRKTVLLFTLCLIGDSTLAIGLLPDANTIGHAAPVKNVRHSRYDGWQVVQAATRPKGSALPYTNNPETMTFNHCGFATAPTTALSPRIQGVL
jgi:MFS family permease